MTENRRAGSLPVKTSNEKVPLFIVCRHCGAVKPVKSPYEQRRRRFCSRRCVGAVYGGVRHMTRAARLEAAMKSRDVRRRQAIAKWAGMSSIQVAREAYSMGWKAGARAVRRKMGFNARGRAIA